MSGYNIFHNGYSPRSCWSVSIVIVTSSSIVLLFWLILPIQFKKNESSDYHNFYKPVAERIVEGKGIVHADGRLATRWPPGYPLLLAATLRVASLSGLSYQTVTQGFNLICAVLSATLLYFISTIFWEQRLSFVTPIVFLTYPPILWLTKQPGSELPFLVFFYGSILLFLKAQFKPNLSTIPFFFSGILIGMAMLIRPIGLGLGIILAGFLLISEQNRSFGYRMVLALMLLGGNLITILPWEYSVYSKTGKIIPLSSGGAAGIYDGLTFGVRSYGFRQKIDLPPDIIHLMEDFDANLSMDNSLADVASRLFEEFQDRPITVAKLFGIKAIRSWFGTDSHRGETFLTIIQIFYLFLFLVGTWFSYRENSFAKKVLILIWVLIAYFWGMAILASPLLRYMTPAIGLLFLTVPALLKIALKWFSKETLFIDSRL